MHKFIGITAHFCKIDNKNATDYYILKCQKHPLLFDSIMGRIDLENGDAQIKEYYNEISNGKINMGEGKEITLTDDKLKELGIK